jgi:hypothetical protein
VSEVDSLVRFSAEADFVSKLHLVPNEGPGSSMVGENFAPHMLPLWESKGTSLEGDSVVVLDTGLPTSSD